MTTPPVTRCGFVAIVGRPNVGKSTLLNQLLGRKLSITSPKPQTTRHQILGVSTQGNDQIIYLDTPGLHQKQAKAINRYMNKAVHGAIKSVDVVVFIVDIQRWTEEDEEVLQAVKQSKKPVILALNKTDVLQDKGLLLPLIEDMQKKMDFVAIVPLAALQGDNVKALETVIREHLPQSVHFYPDDQVSNRGTRFFLAELVREKIMRLLEEEIPYAATVMIEKLEDTENLARIHALIIVEREGQKGILIGKNGAMLKNIGRQARLDMEQLLGKKVYLQLWVKVKEGWSDKESLLQDFGYDKPE
jgi:GTP-binding protein Era